MKNWSTFPFVILIVFASVVFAAEPKPKNGGGGFRPFEAGVIPVGIYLRDPQGFTTTAQRFRTVAHGEIKPGKNYNAFVRIKKTLEYTDYCQFAAFHLKKDKVGEAKIKPIHIKGEGAKFPSLKMDSEDIPLKLTGTAAGDIVVLTAIGFGDTLKEPITYTEVFEVK